MSGDLDSLFEAIRARVADLSNSCDRDALVSHIRALAIWNEEPRDYPAVGQVKFPERLPIAFAVCHPGCGATAFLVDGGPQRCDHCGHSMFRTSVRDYRLA